jgi:hypothetical protein
VLLARFHRVFKGGVDLLAQHGYGLSQNRARVGIEPKEPGGAEQDLGFR